MLAINMDMIPRISFLGFVSYQTPWIHFGRQINEHVLYVIKSGELHLEENGERYVLRRGDGLLLEPGLPHVGVERHVCDYYYIHFRHPDMTRVAGEDGMMLAKRQLLEEDGAEENRCFMPKHFHLRERSGLLRVMAELNELARLYRRKHYNRSLTALKLAELFIAISREHLQDELKRTGKRNTLGRVKALELLDYIHHFYQGKIEGVEIEKRFACNYDYMNRVFKSLTGYSITRYTNKVRIDRAKELLQATTLTVGEIAELAGFQDMYYFSRMFKHYTGISPAAYGSSLKIASI